MNKARDISYPSTLFSRLDPNEFTVRASSYSLFDLHLRSELPLCCLRDVQNESSQPVFLRVSKPWHEWKSLSSVKWEFTGTARDRYNRPQLAGFRNQLGHLITTQTGMYFVDSSLTEISFRPFLNSGFNPWGNSALNVLAGRQQIAGYFTLHGNALGLFGRGVILFGASGTGKSTLTTALVSRGAKVISEDVTCLVQTNRDSIILPGPASIKLESEAARSLGFDPKELPKAHNTSGKLVLAHKMQPDFFCSETLPLLVGYCLNRHQYDGCAWSARVVDSSSHDALLNLLRSCLGLYLLDVKAQGKLLTSLSSLSENIRIKQLHYGSSYERLTEVCQQIETDVRNL